MNGLRICITEPQQLLPHFRACGLRVHGTSPACPVLHFFPNQLLLGVLKESRPAVKALLADSPNGLLSTNSECENVLYRRLVAVVAVKALHPCLHTLCSPFTRVYVSRACRARSQVGWGRYRAPSHQWPPCIQDTSTQSVGTVRPARRRGDQTSPAMTSPMRVVPTTSPPSAAMSGVR